MIDFKNIFGFITPHVVYIIFIVMLSLLMCGLSIEFVKFVKKYLKSVDYRTKFQKSIKDGDKCLIVYDGYTEASIDKVLDGEVVIKITVPLSDLLPLDYAEKSGINYKK